MKKIHTKLKRRSRLGTHTAHYSFLHNIFRKKRPKTFKTEEYAHIYASTHGIARDNYYLKKTKNNKKFEIVLKEK